MEEGTNSYITYFEIFSPGSYQKEIKIFRSGGDGKSIFNDLEQFRKDNDAKKTYEISKQQTS